MRYVLRHVRAESFHGPDWLREHVIELGAG